MAATIGVKILKSVLIGHHLGYCLRFVL